MLRFLGFSSTESVTVGYVFGAGSVEAIQLQSFLNTSNPWALLCQFVAAQVTTRLCSLLCPNPSWELLSAEEGAVAMGVLGLGLRRASVVLVLWTVFTGVLSCLKSLCAPSTAQNRKEPKITRSDFSRFSSASQPTLAA